MPDAAQPPVSIGLKYTTAADGTRSVAIPDELRAQVVSFVRAGGAKTPAEIEAIVQDGHDALVVALTGLSDTQAAHKPSADDWSILELMDHVVTTKQVVVGLCRNLGDGHWPPGIGPEFQEQNAQDGVTISRFATLADARIAADAAHGDLVGFIRGLNASTNVEVRFSHFLFGALNAREWAVFQRIHDVDHTPHIGQIKASCGFPPA
jgi:hypothetical protein